MNKIISHGKSREEGKTGTEGGNGENKKVREYFLDKATFEQS